jgi:putative flippase GtrA
MRKMLSRLAREESVRFIVVGGINTVVGYGLFALFQLTIGHVIGYLGSLYLSYALAMVVAFTLHRRYTFRVTGSGNRLVDFGRFVAVNLVSLAINSVTLPLLVELAHLHPLVAQAIVVVVSVLVSYFGHKWFSFRRTHAAHPAGEESAVDESAPTPAP